MTCASLFSGFGGADIGMKAAGLTPVTAVEYEPKLADVYRANHGDHVRVADVRHVDYKKLERPDVLWMSPVCTNASVANAQGGETELDRECARASVAAAAAWLPRLVFLENVWGYRSFDSFKIICEELVRLGYSFNFWHLNSADYGVPQTRKRLILAAVREKGLHLTMPEPTHSKEPLLTLFGQLERWVGWYEAIEDLLHDLPESKFADWQLARMGAEIPTETFLHMTGARSMAVATRGTGIKDPLCPAGTVASNSGSARALFCDADIVKLGLAMLTGDQYGQRVAKTAPAFTVTAKANAYAPAPVRVFIVEGSAAGPNNPYTLPIAQKDESMFTVRAAGHKTSTRAQTQTGRVVAMTPRALARFQSFPDSYQLSGHRKTDCIGIGNAVPPLLAQRVTEHFSRYL